MCNFFTHTGDTTLLKIRCNDRKRVATVYLLQNVSLTNLEDWVRSVCMQSGQAGVWRILYGP